ncbi:conserved oligomeric Golgi complex subunit 2-like [Pollicipes pollicipes]|uniref:conserved oligomeric Golgi complex subunit 2-like n=1 Tax=Pollicipes pollicipes TaxID=41117 RepID=UPI0018856A56|nr:conserved oligomeric Golgi complex subunit 2-like [Pollicipes pollicipes]
MKDIIGFDSSQLCFNKEEFFKDEFSVDGFVLRYRQQTGLESLRTDLGVYLKVLRSSMIDLINRDYADFVNLSSNLVGLDASISKLEMPLGQLREEVLSVRRSFDDLLEQTGWRLTRLHQVRAQKQYLRLLGSLPGYLERLEVLLSSSGDDAVGEQDGDVVERAASEYNQLTYALSHCGGAALVARLEPRVRELAGRLSARLQHGLLAALDQADADRLAHVLRIFATLDQVTEAESLFRERVVEPYMAEVISPAALRDEPRGLRGLLQNVLRFVPEHAQLLVAVTRREHGAHTGPRYDFLVNAVWPCIIQRLDDELPVIYAPGNPNTLFERYTASMDFVEEFEAACGTAASVERLRNHEAYDRFMKRWNLPVYYQIRLQEIGGALESALAGPDSAAAMWAALRRCWGRDVFLRPLTHRFWQLSLQIVSRYSTWLGGRLEHGEKEKAGLSLEDCVRYLSDIADLSQKLETFIDAVVLPMVPKIPDEAVQSMRDSLETGAVRLRALPPRLTGVYTESLLSDATAAMRVVMDIPRLYRRTNRDPPTTASGYVAAMVAPLEHFSGTVCARLEPALTARYLTGVVTQLCTLYAERVGQVLTSVQRMEESLRKLKKARATAPAAPAGATDDDKIRRQLALPAAAATPDRVTPSPLLRYDRAGPPPAAVGAMRGGDDPLLNAYIIGSVLLVLGSGLVFFGGVLQQQAAQAEANSVNGTDAVHERRAGATPCAGPPVTPSAAAMTAGDPRYGVYIILAVTLALTLGLVFLTTAMPSADSHTDNTNGTSGHECVRHPDVMASSVVRHHFFVIFVVSLALGFGLALFGTVLTKTPTKPEV